jgi:hypothetical protein
MITTYSEISKKMVDFSDNAVMNQIVNGPANLGPNHSDCPLQQPESSRRRTKWRHHPAGLTTSASLTRLTRIGGKNIALRRVNKTLDDCP